MLCLRMLGLLMLMVSLCDADSICPTELNPLILDPTEVLAEYKESVLVNCSSTEEEHSRIYWRVGNTDFPVENNNSYTSLSVLLSDWNVTAECRIMLNETHECSKDLEITIYQNPSMVAVYPTKHAAALEGTPYELQCDIIDVAPVQNLTVRWYRDNEIIRTDTFTNTTKRLVSESSTLAVNISRGENQVQFRCEAQLDFGPHGPQLPVVFHTHNVSIHYAPELINKMEHVDVYDGDSVTLNCEAEAHPHPVFRWIDLHSGMNLSNTNYLNITEVVDNSTYKCTATNYLGSITKQVHVHVMKLITPAAAPAAITTPNPQTPRSCPLVLTPAKVVVKFGGPASAICSTSATDVSTMGWEATSGGKTTDNSSMVTWIDEDVDDWTIKPLCYINLEDNFQCYVMLDITIYKTPDIVTVFAMDQRMMVEGTEHWLQCEVIDVAPAQNLKVTWYRGNETVDTQMSNDTSNVPANLTFTLKVLPERDHHGALFRCEAELLLGPNGPELAPTVTSAPYLAVVHYKPVIKDCPDHYAGVEHNFSMDRLRCEADGNPPPTFQWYYEDKPINASEPLTRTQSGKYTAEIENSLGNTSTSVLITVEYEPSFNCNDRYEVAESGVLQCVPDGIPTPVNTWFKDGIQMASPPRWTKDDSGNYSVRATNKHGSTIHMLYADVLYAPVFAQETYKIEVNPGENVTFDCSAKGNPPPQIHWDFNTSAVNVKATTRGSQNSISVTGATSTNAGIYSCVATNKVGSVTRSVTLIMKDSPKPRAARVSVIWWLLILLVIVLILILIIVAHRWKRRGRYNFVPDKANDGPDIPLSPQSNGVQT